MPHFPTQTLKTAPELIIDLPKSRSDLQGYLDPSQGHSIDHLIVSDLGNEEIILVACDDGDVISYKMCSIVSALEQNVPLGEPWFLENVGRSAWGLAVHKEARMIAVSSNTQKIDVFALALQPLKRQGAHGGYEAPLSEHSDVPDPQESASKFRVHHDGIRDRAHNIRLSLLAHKTNIPSVAFCNTAQDRDGNFLASTDIDNNIFVWNLRQAKVIMHADGDMNMSQSQRGWGITCLDPCTSRLTRDSFETLGCSVDREESFLDVSDAVRSVPDNSRWHPDSLHFGTDFSASSMNPTGSTDEQDSEAETNSADLAEVEEESEDEEGDSGPIAAISVPERKIELSKKPLIVRLPFNILHTSEFAIRLFSDVPCYEGTKFGRTASCIMCNQALHQFLPSSSAAWNQLRSIERLNMIAQIPELGVVAIANQVGRVGILTTTKAREGHLFGYRIECVLPFKSQEQEMRPSVPLMGLAVGPVQGLEKRPEPGSVQDVTQDVPQTRPAWSSLRRYRLLIVYCDHTILSYELSRTDDPDIIVM
ncbi:hypothetical protein ACLMJK_001610 [Lecanora helva]